MQPRFQMLKVLRDNKQLKFGENLIILLTLRIIENRLLLQDHMGNKLLENRLAIHLISVLSAKKCLFSLQRLHEFCERGKKSTAKCKIARRVIRIRFQRPLDTRHPCAKNTLSLTRAHSYTSAYTFRCEYLQVAHGELPSRFALNLNGSTDGSFCALASAASLSKKRERKSTRKKQS